MEGVAEVKADITTHTMTVRFEDSVTGLDKIGAALNEAGYTVGEAEKIAE